MSDHDSVLRAEGWACRVALPHPVVLGPIVYTHREYVILRLTRSDGLTGQAIGYSRGTPLVEALEILCPHALALGTGDPVEAHRRLLALFVPGWSQLVRAASLLDIALWDLAAKARGVPLHRLIGADVDEVPAMAVAGDFADRRPTDELVDEALGFADAGVGAIKLILGGADAQQDLDIAALLRERLPPQVSLAVDFHAPWSDVVTAVGHCRPLLDVALRFIEDPFPATHWRALAALRDQLDVPLAAGEDVTSETQYVDLLEAVSFLRVDATSSGGLTIALRAADAADA